MKKLSICANLIVALLGASPAKSAEAKPAATDIATIHWPAGQMLTNVDGGKIALDSLRGTKATVLVFASIQCPISNGMTKPLNELADSYAAAGVSVVVVNPNPEQSLEAMRRHKAEYGVRLTTLKDPGGILAKTLRVTTCPEALAFDAVGQLRYRGRMDDRFARRGGAAQAVRRHDLKLALDAIIAGKTVEIASTPPVGCPIAFPQATPAGGSAVTYSNQIVRILQKQCVECHRPGGVGPFELTSFASAASWAEDIREFTHNRKMPPWKPVQGFGSFHNERKLTETELALIAMWVKSGCPQGDGSLAPPTRTFVDSWTHGQPDAIVKPSEAYRLSADGPDVYRCFVIPTHFGEDKYVSGIEVLPGNRKVVHHVIAFLDTSDASAKLDAADPGPGYSTHAGFPGFVPAGGLGGWAPGMARPLLPAGFARTLPKDAKIVVQVHYHKSGKPETDLTQLGLYFAKGPVERPVRALPVLSMKSRLSMRIPADDPNYEVTASTTMPRDLVAVGITPHMHLLGKDMKVTATRPDGTVVPLVYIADWDFNWQSSYQYREPVPLPRGTRIDLVAHFDNSSANPNNPNRPPKVVRWGEQTTNEMCIAFVEIAPAQPIRSPTELRLPSSSDLLRELFLGNRANGR